MEKLFSTEDVPPRDRFASWHEIACRTILEHDSRPQSRPTFRAALEKGALADVELLMFRNSPMDFARDRRIIAQAKDDPFLICLQLRGMMAIKQKEREALLEPGDFTIIDPTVPYVGNFPKSSSMLVLKVARDALKACLSKTAEIVARPSKSSHPPSAKAFSYLTRLPTYRKTASSDAAKIRDHALELVASSFGASNEIPQRLSSEATELEANARHFGRPQRFEEVSLRWSNADLLFLTDSLRHGRPFPEIAGFLGIGEAQVRLKALELKLNI